MGNIFAVRLERRGNLFVDLTTHRWTAVVVSFFLWCSLTNGSFAVVVLFLILVFTFWSCLQAPKLKF